MDQKTLVTEQVDAARELIARFGRRFPLAAAFWLKPSEKGRWYLYLAYKPGNAADVSSGYEQVVRLVRELQDPEVSLIRIKLIPADSRLARAAIDAARLYPAGRVLESDGDFLGDTSVDGVYFYPPAALSSAGQHQSNTEGVAAAPNS